MKRLFLILSVLLSLCSALMPMQAEAQSGGVKKIERECVRAIRALPLRLREAFLAQKFQLLFVEGKGSPYDGVYTSNEPVYRRGAVIRHETISFPRAASAARFVGSDGHVYHFYTVHGNAPQAHKDWKLAGRTFHHTGPDAIQVHFQKEIRELEYRQAEYFLKQMPPTHRQAFIALIHELCYMPSGGPAFTRVYEEDFCGYKLPTYAMVKGCAFIGADGKPVDYHQVMAEMEQTRGFFHWKSLRLVWFHGCKKMLQPYQEEVEAMRQHHAALKDASGGASVLPTPPAAPEPPPAPGPEKKTPPASPLGTPMNSPLGAPVMPGAEE